MIDAFSAMLYVFGELTLFVISKVSTLKMQWNVATWFKACFKFKLPHTFLTFSVLSQNFSELIKCTSIKNDNEFFPKLKMIF
jgi:hypothetical protein